MSDRVLGRRLEAGSALVEYALVVIVFLTILFGMVDFGRALYTYHYLSGAAKDATRWAAVNGYTCKDDSSCSFTGGAGTTDIQNYVSSNAPSGVSTSRLTTAVSYANPNSLPICSTHSNYPGCVVVVQVTYSFNFISPLVHRGSVNLQSKSQMVISH